MNGLSATERSFSTAPSAALPADSGILSAKTTGIRVLGIFLFLAYSRVLDLFPVGIRLPLILSLICFIFVLANGQFFRAMIRSPGA